MKKIFLSLLAVAAGLLSAQDSIPHKRLAALQFRSVGPAGMSGRITAIAVDPRNENHIYAGSASGGLWRSRNGGTTWQCIFNNEAVSSVGALALHPQNPDVIWLGSGEGNPRNSATGGYGIYKSIDGGRSWRCMGLEETRYIHRILVHPHRPNTLYVAAPGNMWADSPERGVYKSTDGGQSWKKILYLDPRTGAAEMVMDPQNPDKLLVNMWEHRRQPWFFTSGGKSGGLYLSYNGGETWQKRGAEHGLPKGPTGRMGLAIAASQPSRVYALVENEAKNAFYRSDDGGLHWQKVSEDPNVGNRPFYYAEIYVDPQNENRIYSLWSVLSRSEDAGKSWEVIANYSAIHPDHHAFYIHPQNPSYLIEGNDGGLNISRDRGATWRFVENLPLAQFYHLDYDTLRPYHLYGGMQDNGSWKGPAYNWRRDGLRNDYWQELYFGDGFRVLPQRGNPRYVYAMSQEGYLSRVDSETGHSKLIRPVHPGGEALRYNWNAPLALDYFSDSTLYFGAQYLFRSRDCGAHWELLSPDLTTNDSSKQNYFESGGLTYDVTGAENYTTLLCVEPSSLERDLLWTGSDDGLLHLSRDGGENWQELSARLKGLPRGAWLPQIRHSVHRNGAAFVVANDYRRGNWQPYLYYTDNYGKSFRRLVNGEQVEGYVLSVVQDRQNPALLFLGTQRGLYFSHDFGRHWQKWGKDFPTVPVTALKLQPSEDDLIAGTFGRSAYVFDDMPALRSALNQTTEELWLAPVEDSYQVSYRRADGSRFPANTAFKGENRSAGARLFFYSPYDPADSLSPKKAQLIFFNHAGDTLCHHWVDYRAGLNRWDWNLRKRGLHFPTRNETLNDTTEHNSRMLSPGLYRAQVLLGASPPVEQELRVHGDPRLNLSPQSWQQREAFADAWQGLLDSLEIYSQKLRISRALMDMIENDFLALAKALKIDAIERKSMAESIKKFRAKLKKLEDQLYGKEVDGYYKQPETLREQYYMISRYYRSNWDEVRADTRLLLENYRVVQQKWQREVNEFFREMSTDSNMEVFMEISP